MNTILKLFKEAKWHEGGTKNQRFFSATINLPNTVLIDSFYKKKGKTGMEIYPADAGEINWSKLPRFLPKSPEEFARWIEIGHTQYLENIRPENLIDRIPEDWEQISSNLDSKVRIKGDAISKYQKSGITPFLKLDKILIFEQSNTAFFKFKCELDEYLDEYGFCLLKKNGNVEFVINEVAETWCSAPN